MSKTRFLSINPVNGAHIAAFDKFSLTAVGEILHSSYSAFQKWKDAPVEERSRAVAAIGRSLSDVRDELSRMITLEMGKPISQSLGEVDKCIWLCEYYAENASALLQHDIIEVEGFSVLRRRDPLGPVFGIMPWNFPIWQALRYAIPSIAVGNSALLKPAPNVIGSSLILEKAIAEALGEKALFRVLIMDTDIVEDVIASEKVRGVTFTGSDKAGGIVAGLAGKYRKPAVLELGGSDPFIVLRDADIEAAGKAFVQSRMNNTGQTCIAAKRAIVDADILDNFVDVIDEATGNLVIGAPDMSGTEISCLAREDLCQNLVHQVAQSSSVVQKVVSGGRVSGTNYYHPEHYIVKNRSAALWREEVFGPVGVIHDFSTLEEAIDLANDTRYGLGCSIWTSDKERAQKVAAKTEAGSIHINRIVSSDPRVPFGGVKDSGFGRELGDTGLFAFCNEKIVSSTFPGPSL